jgi:hypothetical protein
MKFHTQNEVNLFFLEIASFDQYGVHGTDYKPTNEEMELFLKNRKGKISAIKDFRKGQLSKANWRKNRFKIMKGIKRFHKSTAGKRFHRKLSRFILTRDSKKVSKTDSKERKDEAQAANYFNKIDTATSINSAISHLICELNYYHPFDEHIEVEEATYFLLPLLEGMRNALLANRELDEEDLRILLFLIESSALIKSLALKSGKDITAVDKLWKETRKELEDKGKSEEDDGFFQELVGVLKKKLKLD